MRFRPPRVSFATGVLVAVFVAAFALGMSSGGQRPPLRALLPLIGLSLLWLAYKALRPRLAARREARRIAALPRYQVSESALARREADGSVCEQTFESVQSVFATVMQEPFLYDCFTHVVFTDGDEWLLDGRHPDYLPFLEALRERLPAAPGQEPLAVCGTDNGPFVLFRWGSALRDTARPGGDQD